MQITDVRVRKASSSEGKVKAYCSVVLDEMFVIHEIRVVEGARGVFVSMPRRKTGESEFRDLAHPITAEARTMLQSAVMQAYLKLEPQQVDQPQEPQEGGEVEEQQESLTA